MENKTDWTAIFHRVIAFPLYLYFSVAVVTSSYCMELSFNYFDWSIFVRTALSTVVVTVYGLVLFGYLSGNFKVKK